jgi:hypothetical protein
MTWEKEIIYSQKLMETLEKGLLVAKNNLVQGAAPPTTLLLTTQGLTRFFNILDLPVGSLQGLLDYFKTQRRFVHVQE